MLKRRLISIAPQTLRDSSAEEHHTVNVTVGGSIPPPGARQNNVSIIKDFQGGF